MKGRILRNCAIITKATTKNKRIARRDFDDKTDSDKSDRIEQRDIHRKDFKEKTDSDKKDFETLSDNNESDYNEKRDSDRKDFEEKICRRKEGF